LRADEKKLFEAAMLPHLDAAYNLARWLAQDEHAAEDVVQEAYLRAARYFGSFHGGSARAWLLGVVRRAAIDWFARQQAHASVALDDSMCDRDEQAANPQFLALRKCDQERVRAALESLPSILREALVLRELEGLSYQEIANVTEAPIGTVMSRISRGRQQLQTRLAPYAEGNMP
jgi:RNA polymerase sigma-70 factor (ECF subfamily)